MLNCFHNLLSCIELYKPFSHLCTINLFLPSLINKSLVFASSIFLQPLTPSTTTYYLKDCLPGSVLLTWLSTRFSPILLLALSQSKHLKHHPNNALSPMVFRKVQFSGPYFLSSILLHLAHPSKHPQLTRAVNVYPFTWLTDRW